MDMYQQEPAQNNWKAMEQLSENPNANRSGLAVASFVLGLVSFLMICCCGCISIIAAPLSIVFAIISLKGRRARKGMSIAGIIFSSLAVVVMVWSVSMSYVWIKNIDVVVDDYTSLSEDAENVFSQYKENGELPEYLQKYQEGDFKEWFDRFGLEFTDAMDWLNEQYDNGTLLSVTDQEHGDDSPIPAN